MVPVVEVKSEPLSIGGQSAEPESLGTRFQNYATSPKIIRVDNDNGNLLSTRYYNCQ